MSGEGEASGAETSEVSENTAEEEREAEEGEAVATDVAAADDAPPAPKLSAIDRYLAIAPRYFALADFAAVPKTKAGWVLRVAVTFLALLLLQRRVLTATRPLLTAKPPAAIPTEEVEDYRFRLPERTRRDIFHDLATAEISERARAIQANTWNGHLWSREDDRGHFERVAARAAAAKYKVSLTQVYLVLDEGIRAGWPGPDGKPLSPITPPLNMRTGSW